MNLFQFCKIKKRNFNLFSSRTNMVRQKARKPVENLYMSVPPATPLAATRRFDENVFQNSKTNKNDKSDICIHNTVTCRKKSKGRNPVEKKDQKTLINEEKVLERSKKTEVLDSKNSFNMENEKDEDTEEFFRIIKETVEGALEKSIQEMIPRSLRNVTIKLDEIQERVNTYENFLEKIRTEMINKIIHYGEENSRHFRYLCMKSEYDKMFYQHQNVITAIPLDARPNVVNQYAQHLVPPSEPLAQTIHQAKSAEQPNQLPTNFSSKCTNSSTLAMACNCHNNGFIDFDCTQRSKLSVSSKSSDIGIREVKDLLEHLQKFYDQHNHEKNDKKIVHGNGALNIPDQDYSADGDEDDESSDDMSSPSIEENIGAGGDS